MKESSWMSMRVVSTELLCHLRGITVCDCHLSPISLLLQWDGLGVEPGNHVLGVRLGSSSTLHVQDPQGRRVSSLWL